MLTEIKANIEARYISRGPGITDIELATIEGVTARAIYLQNGQLYSCSAQEKKIILQTGTILILQYYFY